MRARTPYQLQTTLVKMRPLSAFSPTVARRIRQAVLAKITQIARDVQSAHTVTALAPALALGYWVCLAPVIHRRIKNKLRVVLDAKLAQVHTKMSTATTPNQLWAALTFVQVFHHAQTQNLSSLDDLCRAAAHERAKRKYEPDTITSAKRLKQ